MLCISRVSTSKILFKFENLTIFYGGLCKFVTSNFKNFYVNDISDDAKEMFCH